jgi:2-polyprenyl-3-methyl-5-hydroxy-6-metoxy-1,4-benzoquinol methylase
MHMDDPDTVIELARRLRQALEARPHLTDTQFEELSREWQGVVGGMKRIAFSTDPRNKQDVAAFEYGWGGQSAQFIVDLVPRLQAAMLRHYKRQDVLKLIDIGAGSCVGTNILATLHSDHVVWSRLEIDAIDYTPIRKRWVQSQFPKINYMVGDAFALPDRHWDFVVCSHVVEHLEDPRPFIENIKRICRGFAFVYSPYREIDRIAAHVSTIDESTYAGIPECRLEVVPSMGWHPAKPEDKCLIATIDCRESRA